jgi:multidrug efflux pump subunit AcrB
LAVTLGVSLFTSLALALTWTPTLSSYFIRKHKDEPESRDKDNYGDVDEEESLAKLLAAEEASLGPRFRKIIDFHQRWLRRALARPLWLAGLSVVLIASAYVCYRFSGNDLLPEMDEGDFTVDYLTPAGSSLSETNRMVQHLEEIIKTIPEVESSSRRTGAELGPAAVTEANRGDILVKLKKDRKRGIDLIMEDVRGKIAEEEPGVQVEFVQILQDMIGDLMGEREPIQIKLFSQNPAETEQWAPKVADAIRKLPGVVDVFDGIENTISGPALSFQVDPAVASRAGFTPEEIATDVSALVQGEPATTPVISNDRVYTIRIRFPQNNRISVDTVRDTVLASSSGRTATLGSLATITELPGQTEIHRENLLRVVMVTGRLEGTDLGSAVTAVQKTVSGLHLPPGIRVDYGGTYKEEQKSFRDLVFVLMLAIILVFIVLLFEFGSFAAPLAILASALLSTSGVFIALLITRTTFNVSSFMGMIMVVGIVAKNGILLLDADQRIRATGASAEEAMLQASRRRLRPIVMTALATMAGMLPLAFAIGAGSQMLQPLAIAVIGGILISMVLSLIITPAVHFYLGHKEENLAPVREEMPVR